MNRIFLLLFLLIFHDLKAQNKADSISQVRNYAHWLDLNYTESEADSLLANLRAFRQIYRNMHAEMPPNDLRFPFAFDPRPHGFVMPGAKPPAVWKLPETKLPKNRADLAFYSLPQLAYLIRSRQISSVELTQFFINRLKQWGDTLESVITLTEDLALKEAAQADADLKKGIYRGPLHGIPYGLKDLFAVPGYPTTWGTTPYKEQVIDEESYVYQKLRKAGAVLVAKLSLGSLAYNNKWFGGETKNPWNLQQGSSGSSAGSAASVVAGLVPFTIGTETLGSIVSPSTRCGATGLRPTFGTVSRSGGMVLCWSLDKVGPICRSAEDAALVYQYLHGTDGKDESARDHAFNYHPSGSLKGLKIAYAEHYFRRLPANAMEWQVLKEFEAMGVKPVAVTFPDSGVYKANLVSLILNAEAAAALDELTRSDRDSLIERQDRDFWPNSFRASRFIPAVEYINANRYRSRLIDSVQAFFKDWDVVIVPTFVGNQLSITNLTGNPVVCLPMGFNNRGLPQSISFLGKLYGEAAILQAAKAYQDRTDHHKKHPQKFIF